MSSPSPDRPDQGSSTQLQDVDDEARALPLWVRLLGTLAIVGIVAGAWLLLRDPAPKDPPLAAPAPARQYTPPAGPSLTARRAVRSSAEEFLENFRRWTWGRRIPLSKLQPAVSSVQQGLAYADPDWRLKRRRPMPRMLIGKAAWSGTSIATVPFRADPDPLGGRLEIRQDVDDTWRVTDMTLETIPGG